MTDIETIPEQDLGTDIVELSGRNIKFANVSGLTAAMIDSLCAAYDAGATDSMLRTRFNLPSLSKWIKEARQLISDLGEDPDSATLAALTDRQLLLLRLLQRTDVAKGEQRLKTIKVIMDAIDGGDIKAAQWYIERTDKEFARQQEVSVTVQQKPIETVEIIMPVAENVIDLVCEGVADE